VSLGYRLLATAPCGGPGEVPQQCYDAAFAAQHDAQAAVRWLRTNAAFLRVDPDRIAIAGESAGAVTALLTGWRRDDPDDSGNPGPSSSVGAAVSVAGGIPTQQYIGPGDSPAFFFHGTADTIVPFSWAAGNVASMHRQGLVVGIRAYHDQGHGILGPSAAEIFEQATYFLYYMLDLARASGVSVP
jgi:dipeptidyl aminopeptidase/acylaminoacyl peptidase